MEDHLAEQLADRFPFLFPLSVRRPAPAPRRDRDTPRAAEAEDRLLGFLSAVALAYYFHRIGHVEPLLRPVREAIRKYNRRGARRLQVEMLRWKPDAFRELFRRRPEATAAADRDPVREYDRILRDVDPAPLVAFLAERFRAEVTGLPEGGEEGSGPDLPIDAVGSHRIELKLEGGVRIPLFPYLAAGLDGGAYLFRGFDGDRAAYSPLAGTGSRTTRDPSVRKCLAEYYLQMAHYADSRRIFDGLRGAAAPGDHRGLWASVYGSLGDRFYRQGRYADAARILERSLLHRPNIPRARFQLWEAYRKLGRRGEAEKVILPVLERYPDLDQAHALLERSREEGRRETAPAAPRSPAGRIRPAGPDRTGPVRRGETGPARPRPEAAPRGLRRRVAEYLDDVAEAAAGPTPLIGREREMEEILQVLSCRDKRNPLLVGDAGVGKSAIVEELARRFASPDQVGPMQGRRILALNQAALLAGAKYRGEFEERMLEIVAEVRRTESVLFVDHIHTIVQPAQARGAALDAGGLLKGPLMRGEIQMIATTTFEDQQNVLDKDPTLCRCFQRVPIEEPVPEEAGRILVGARHRYEDFHGVGIEEQALQGSLEAIQRYLPEGNLPDKGFDVIDRAAARVALAAAAGERSDRRVGERDLLETIAEMARIPSSRVSQGFRHNLIGLEDFLGGRIIGQRGAVDTVSRVLRSTARGLKLHPDRPNGVFLFLGPTGVGKTELARALSEALFGGTEGMIRIDMSEYMDRISTSRLIGAAPGYVGYNDLNQLTDRVRRRPYCLILLDEVEKADPQAMQLFLQVFDAGRLTDGRGRTVSFGATTIVMTSNVGSELYTRSTVGYSQREAPSRASRETLQKELMNRFSPEFLNRIDEFVFFRRLSEVDIRDIAGLQLREIRSELARQGKTLQIEEEALEWVARRGFSPIWGARDLGRCLRREILDPLARISLGEEWSCVERIQVRRRGDRLSIVCLDSDRRPLFETESAAASA